MINKHIVRRLEGMHAALRALYSGGDPLTSASRGTEREHFLNTLLNEVFPPPFRFGSGDITDRSDTRSGQCDIVVEHPFLPSFPLFPRGPRLYLAEGVAAVIEVKSDVPKQWDQVQSWASALAQLRRDLGTPAIQIGDQPKDIPRFVVGYAGWQQLSTVRDHLRELDLDGLLVIDPGLYVSSDRFGHLQLTGSES